MQIRTISALLMEIITIRPTIKQRSKTNELLILDNSLLNRNTMAALERSPLWHFSVGLFNKDNPGNDSLLRVGLQSHKHPCVV